MKIAYLGPEKSYTHRAARQFFPSGDLISVSPIRRVVNAVETKQVDQGVIPFENFYNGEVREALDSLTDDLQTRIIGETSIKIVHCLGALKNHTSIERILSKDQALEQCSKYIYLHYPDAVTMATASTSEAVKEIAENKLLQCAAIASKEALLDYELEILAEDLCPNNKTRFAILGREPTNPTKDDKTFLALHPIVNDKPGVLNDITSIFASLNINLEFIQSRPDGNKGYYFYIELDGHKQDEKVVIAIQALRVSLDPEKQHPDAIKILGSYKNSHWKE